MGKVLGIAIQNYGTLQNIKMGQLYNNRHAEPLENITAIIGSSGSGKSTLADAFGFLSDCLLTDIENACDVGNRGGYEQIISQGISGPICFEIYYRETSSARPITYELKITEDKNGRPYIQEERLWQITQKTGCPMSFLHLKDGKGYVFTEKTSGQDDDGEAADIKVDVELSDTRKLGIATFGEMKQYSEIERFLIFLRSLYLCHFSPDAARQIQTAAPTPYLNRDGSNLNNVVQYMYRENPKEFEKILADIQTKIPDITKIQPVKLQNGQMYLEFWQKRFAEPFFSQRISDGILKLLAYYLLLSEKNPRKTVFIEEPENSLYHQYLPDLAAEMSKNTESGCDKQLFVTTQSPFFVNALSSKDVWILKKGDNGFSNIERASDYKFVNELMQKGALMGDLWHDKYFDR